MSSIKQEAEKCLKCKNARCSANCPASTPIPQVVELFLNGNIKKAGEVLFDYIRPAYLKYVFHGSRETKFALATLGNDAGIYGSAKLVLDSESE